MGKRRWSQKERQRAEILANVKKAELSLGKAAELLGVSFRQMLRINARYQEEGSAGLVHGLRDQPSNPRIESTWRERVLELFHTK